MLGMNGTRATDFRRLFVRWVTTYEDGYLKVVGYCVYDGEACKTLFEHADREVCEKVLKMILNDETKGNKC
jgi:hypothetical protein